MKTTEEQDEQYLRKQMQSLQEDLLQRTDEQRTKNALTEFVSWKTSARVVPFPREDVREGISGTGTGLDDWHEPDVELRPVPGTNGRVNRTLSHTNLPGGVLMDTRRFEKWVLESFVPLQDQVITLLERCDYLLEKLNVANSRVSRLEQRVRELKSTKSR